MSKRFSSVSMGSRYYCVSKHSIMYKGPPLAHYAQLHPSSQINNSDSRCFSSSFFRFRSWALRCSSLWHSDNYRLVRNPSLPRPSWNLGCLYSRPWGSQRTTRLLLTDRLLTVDRFQSLNGVKSRPEDYSDEPIVEETYTTYNLARFSCWSPIIYNTLLCLYPILSPAFVPITRLGGCIIKSESNVRTILQIIPYLSMSCGNVVSLYTINLHSIFKNTSVTIGAPRDDPYPWVQLHFRKCHAFM
jgi:hypothetical protein